MRKRYHKGSNARASAKLNYKNKLALLKFLEAVGPRLKNKTPILKQVRLFQSKRSAFKRRIKGNIARLATLGYVKPLSSKKLKPCKGIRKQIKKAYFGFKMARNWKRGGNRTKDFRPKNVAKSRFTVLNCK